MKNNRFKITEVTGSPGGECYLVEYDNNAVLCDTGFSFAAPKVAENIQSAASKAARKYILISHAHYDHAGGVAYIKKKMPDFRVAANILSAKIFERPGALKLMRELDRAAAEENGVWWEEIPRGLFADIILDLSEGDREAAPGIIAIATPGHTKDTTSYYFEDIDLLIVTETTGVQLSNRVLPSFITGYNQSLNATRRIEEIGARHILVPHYGLASDDEAAAYPKRAYEACVKFADFVMSRHARGMSSEQIVREYTEEYYDKQIASTGKQPRAAFATNADAVIPRLIAELSWGNTN